MSEEFMEQKGIISQKEGIQLLRYNIMFRIISDEELENDTMNYPDASFPKVFDSLDVLINLKRKTARADKWVICGMKRRKKILIIKNL